MGSRPFLLPLLTSRGWQINKSKGDGHCLLYSVDSSLCNQFPNFPPVDIETIKARIFIETVKNTEYYLPFLQTSSKSALSAGLGDYLIKKQYNNDFGDLVPCIIANALSIKLNILDEDQTGYVNTVVITPHDQSKASLVLHRRSQHYNGITLFAAVRTDRNIGLCYSSVEIKSLRPNATKITRPVRKVLFKHGLWNSFHEPQQTSLLGKKLCANGVNKSNLINVSLSSVGDVGSLYNSHGPEFQTKDLTSQSGDTIRIGFLNARSVKNKTTIINDHVTEKDLDVLALNETWLAAEDGLASAGITPPGYCLHQVPRKHGRSGYGGIAVLCKRSLDVKITVPEQCKSFECMEALFTCDGTCVRLIVIYRPPPSKKNNLTVKDFMTDFSTYLETHVITTGKLVILGDFNFHMDKCDDTVVRNFKELLYSSNLHQHIDKLTHRSGHTLDLLITRTDENILASWDVDPPDIISDHSAVTCQLLMYKTTESHKRQVTRRNYNKIDRNKFREDILKSCLYCDEQDLSLDCLVELYNKTILALLDLHAPAKTKDVKLHKEAPWYTEAIRAGKRLKRQLERRWRKTRLTVDRIIYKDHSKLLHTIVEATKMNYFTNLVQENAGDQKMLFRIIGNLLCDNIEKIFPLHQSAETLAEEFATFFTNKVCKIQHKIDSAVLNSHLNCENSPISQAELD
jgi:exonuclease III